MRAAELRALPSAALVARVLEDHVLFKPVAEIFLERPPDDDTARLLVTAYEGGGAPPWLTACLLGRLRARSAYPTVRKILDDAPGLLAESYAAVSMATIAGADARADLLAILRGAKERRSREGAMYGLAELGDPSLVGAIVEAARDRRVRPRQAASTIAALAAPTTLVAWLRGADELERYLAVHAVFSLSAQEGGLTDVELARAAREASSLVEMSPSTRALLLERIAKLLG